MLKTSLTVFCLNVPSTRLKNEQLTHAILIIKFEGNPFSSWNTQRCYTAHSKCPRKHYILKKRTAFCHYLIFERKACCADNHSNTHLRSVLHSAAIDFWGNRETGIAPRANLACTYMYFLSLSITVMMHNDHLIKYLTSSSNFSHLGWEASLLSKRRCIFNLEVYE